MKTKICSKCGIDKPLDDFHNSNKVKCGKKSRCKICRSEDYKNAFNSNPELFRVRSKIYRRKHPKRIKESQKKYRDSELGKAKSKEWRKNNPDKVKKIKQRYNKTESCIKSKKKWTLNNRDKIYNYRDSKYKEDIQFNLRKKIRRRIDTTLRRREVSKVDKTIKLLGCDFNFYKKYLESLFSDGMTWELLRAGKIHIDHIKPLSSFDLTKPEEQKKAFHYSNTQPLWAEDNLKKSDKVNFFMS